MDMSTAVNNKGQIILTIRRGDKKRDLTAIHHGIILEIEDAGLLCASLVDQMVKAKLVQQALAKKK